MIVRPRAAAQSESRIAPLNGGLCGFRINRLLGCQEAGRALAELVEPAPIYLLALPIKASGQSKWSSSPLHSFARLPINARHVHSELRDNSSPNCSRVISSNRPG
jgi:hypothetical protein